MADQLTMGSSPNEWKRVKVTAGQGTGNARKSIFSLFGGKDPSAYFAPGLENSLFLDGDKGVTFSVSTKYVPVLEQMMKKFKDSSLGKAVGLIQKMSDLAAGLDLSKLAENIKTKGVGGTAAMKAISILPANVRYQTKFQNLPAWDSTGPVELGSFTFKFYLGMAGVYDGRTEVYNPALAFSKINQPSEIATGVLQGPIPNTAWVYGVIGGAMAGAISSALGQYGGGATNILGKATIAKPNPKDKQYQSYVKDDYLGNKDSKKTISTPDGTGNPDYKAAVSDYEAQVAAASSATPPRDFAGEVSSNIEKTLNSLMGSFEEKLDAAITSWPGVGLLQIQIGKIALPRMTVEKTSVEFSYDTDDNGFPIWAEVVWSGCKTMEVATIQQMPLLTSDSSGKTFVDSRDSITPAVAEASNTLATSAENTVIQSDAAAALAKVGVNRAVANGRIKE